MIELILLKTSKKKKYKTAVYSATVQNLDQFICKAECFTSHLQTGLYKWIHFVTLAI